MYDYMEKYFEQLPGLVIIDMDGIVFYVNQQCADYFQIAKKEIIGRHIRDVFPETKMMENLDKDEPVIVFDNT